MTLNQLLTKFTSAVYTCARNVSSSSLSNAGADDELKCFATLQRKIYVELYEAPYGSDAKFVNNWFRVIHELSQCTRRNNRIAV